MCKRKKKKIEELSKICYINPVLQLDNVTKRVGKLENNLNVSSSHPMRNVHERVEKLEHNMNSHLLLCSGVEIKDKIAKATTDNVVNVDQIKAEICSEICGDDISGISVGSVSVTVYGKQKKSLKVECNSIYTRNFLLRQARTRRPKGIYLTEFLCYEKMTIYRKLIEVKKKNQGKIVAVQIRGKHICCRTTGEDSFRQVNSLTEVEEIERQLVTTNSNSNGDSSTQ